MKKYNLSEDLAYASRKWTNLCTCNTTNKAGGKSPPVDLARMAYQVSH